MNQQHITDEDIQQGPHFWVKPEKQRGMVVCCACAQSLREKGEDVRDIEGWLFGYPVMQARTEEVPGLYSGPKYVSLIEQEIPFNGKEQNLPE